MSTAAPARGRDSRDDLALIARARDGDAAAFAEIVRRHQAAVYRAALAALGSPADAEEVAQDAFVAASRSLGSFRAAASLRTWLLAIAWRKALTRRRRARAWNVLTGRMTPRSWGEPEETLGALAGMSPAPDAEAIAADLRRRIRALIRALPSKLRDPFLLASSERYSYDEISAMLGAPVGTIKWRVAEARRMLKAKLRALGYER